MENCYTSYLGDEVCESTGPALGIWLLILGIAIVLIIVLARYCYKVATRTGRSRVGFVWLSILLPAAAWVICLVIDKDDRRYTDEDRQKNQGSWLKTQD